MNPDNWIGQVTIPVEKVQQSSVDQTWFPLEGMVRDDELFIYLLYFTLLMRDNTAYWTSGRASKASLCCLHQKGAAASASF
jgi:hypothetical protein